jgi:hypothetical protein
VSVGGWCAIHHQLKWVGFCFKYQTTSQHRK